MAANTASFIQGGEELYRTKSYSYNLQDLAKLMEGGADAIVRPYPTYVHYSDNPEVIQATSDVYMYGNVITHNSYKSPDYVNSFKWDRKIEVDGTSTYEYINIWSAMIKTHTLMNKVQYPDNMDTNTFNVWGQGNASTQFALWDGNEAGTSGYYFIIANRLGGSIGFGGFDGAEIIYNTNSYNFVGGDNSHLDMQPFTAILAKK